MCTVLTVHAGRTLGTHQPEFGDVWDAKVGTKHEY
jgi:hypothetical protein